MTLTAALRLTVRPGCVAKMCSNTFTPTLSTKPPDHPTTAIAWDLQRTFGESEGRRLLLYASRRWDAKPLRAREVVMLWWDDEYEPQAWVDEYLADTIHGWRWERDRLRERAIREAEEAKVDARVKRARERVAALELAFEGGWRPNAGKKWPHPEVVAYCSMVGSWFDPMDRVEATIEFFENKHAQYMKFAEDYRAGRIPRPSAPEDHTPTGFKPRLGPTLLGRKRK
jgi:hypothetical protein